MTVEDIYSEFTDSTQLDPQVVEQKDFKVVVEDSEGFHFNIKAVRWDHENRKAILELE